MKKLILCVMFLSVNAANILSCGWLGFDRMEPGFILAGLETMVSGYSDKWKAVEWDDRDLMLDEWKKELKIRDKANWLEYVFYGPDNIYGQQEREDSFKDRQITAKKKLAIYGAPMIEYTRYILDRAWKDRDPWSDKDDLSQEEFLRLKALAYSPETPYFLKRRYAYQAMKYAAWLKDDAVVVRIFEEIISSSKEKDSIYFRTINRCSSALARLGDKKGSITKYMDTYVKYPKQRLGIQREIKNIFSKDEMSWYINSQAPVFARAAVAYMAGDLQALTYMEPGTDRTKYAVFERIKQLDAEIVPKIWKRYAAGNVTQKISEAELYTQEITDLKKIVISQLKADASVRAQIFYLTMNGYLVLLEGDLTGAEVLFDRAIAAAGERSLAAKQAKALKMIAYLGRTTASDAAFQDNILKYRDVMDLDKRVLYSLLAARFMNNKDTVRAALCIGKAGEYSSYMNFVIDYKLSMEELDVLKAIVGNAGTQPMDKSLAMGLTLTADDVTYIQAMIYMKKKDYAKAYALLESIKTLEYWPKGGKFTQHEDFGESQWLNKGVIIYPKHSDQAKEVKVTKLELAKMLMNLSKPEEDNEKAAENYMTAAAIYRRCPYVSYADVLWGGNRIWTLRTNSGGYYFSFDDMFGSTYEESNKMAYDASHDNMLTAASYYIKAAELTNNAERAAECLGYAASLKAACLLSTKEELDKLKSKYAETEFYKAYSNICTWIKYNYSQN